MYRRAVVIKNVKYTDSPRDYLPSVSASFYMVARASKRTSLVHHLSIKLRKCRSFFKKGRDLNAVGKFWIPIVRRISVYSMRFILKRIKIRLIVV